MSKTIYKFPLNLMGTTKLILTDGYEIISVGNQEGRLVAWVELDPKAEQEEVRIESAVTGGVVPDAIQGVQYPIFVGTVIIGPHVAHVYDVWDPKREKEMQDAKN